jgi:nicotinate-nucleotide pyrophosphorylase (carboxylating)
MTEAFSIPDWSLLLAERTALNLLCHLSGIASATAEWVSAVAGTKSVIRDTRKTTPGLRMVEKYAVRCGGGVNHRMNLSDAVLVKDNHVAAAGGIVEALTLVRGRVKDLPIEIEVDSLDQLTEAISAGADLILLDNFTVDEMKFAVEIRRVHQATFGRPVLLEASGGLTLETARAVATTGVDFLAVGSLTHSSSSLDIGLDFSGSR